MQVVEVVEVVDVVPVVGEVEEVVVEVEAVEDSVVDVVAVDDVVDDVSEVVLCEWVVVLPPFPPWLELVEVDECDVDDEEVFDEVVWLPPPVMLVA